MDLLAGYGSDSDGEEDFFKEPVEDDVAEAETSEKPAISTEKVETKSFFFNDAEPGTSDEDDNGGKDEDEEDVYDPRKLARKRKAVTELEGDFESKIFDNDFAREERLNAEALSKHVQMSDKPAVNAPKKSKFTCKAYLKGKCRFGDRCRFAHPVHDRKSEIVDQVTISAGASLYTETQEAQVFHSKKFKSSAPK